MALKKIVGRSGTYYLLKLIGKGGMGSVYSARWVAHVGEVSKSVAVKLLHGLELTAEERERFLNEARILAKLNHPGIVSIFDVGEVNGQLYLVMEWIDGKDLRRFLQKLKKKGRRLDPVVCTYILGELLKALAHAHDLQIAGAPAPIAHYDVKHENILISSDGLVKLTDFGISRFVAQADGTMSRAMGTFRYMSPEQMFGRVRVESDLWSSGVVGVELFHFPERWLADVPAERFQQTVLSGYVPDLSGPDIPPHIVALLRQMLSLKPEDRPRAADGHAFLIERTPYYQLGSKRLEELYALCGWGKHSGHTEAINVDLGGSEAPQTPPPLSNDLGPEPNATPNEPTRAEPRDERGDEDSPIVFRRDRNRVTPADRTIVDQVADRTSTKGPPMLSAFLQPAVVKPPAVIAEPPPAIIPEPPSPAIEEEYPAPPVEPTEILPPLFANDAAPPPSVPRPGYEADVPAQQQTLPFPGGRPLPIADAPSQPLNLAPVSGPHQRSAFPWKLVGVASVAAVFVGVGLGVLTSKRPAEADQQAAAADRIEVDSFGPGGNEQSSDPPIDPQHDTTPEPVPEQEVAATTQPATTEHVADDTESSTSSAEETPTIDDNPEPKPEEKPKPKPKPKPAVPSTTVLFLITGGAPTAEITVNGRALSYNGYYARTKLRPGKDHSVKYRVGEKADWHPPRTLTIKALDPGWYYQVHLSPSGMDVSTRQEGSAGK